MLVDVAIGCLTRHLPGWLRTELSADDRLLVTNASGGRRKQEIEWSRALKASLLKRVENFSTAESPRGANRSTATSISHDRNFTAIAVARSAAMGIDLQSDRSLESCYQIADAWFPRRESAEIQASGSCDRFLKSWVIKESWAKCMNKSIFDACVDIGIWGGGVHVLNGVGSNFRCAWFRKTGDTKTLFKDPKSPTQGFAVGICMSGNLLRENLIQSLVPHSDHGLSDVKLNWEMIPVTGSSTMPL